VIQRDGPAPVRATDRAAHERRRPWSAGPPPPGHPDRPAHRRHGPGSHPPRRRRDGCREVDPHRRWARRTLRCRPTGTPAAPAARRAPETRGARARTGAWARSHRRHAPATKSPGRRTPPRARAQPPSRPRAPGPCPPSSALTTGPRRTRCGRRARRRAPRSRRECGSPRPPRPAARLPPSPPATAAGPIETTPSRDTSSRSHRSSHSRHSALDRSAMDTSRGSAWEWRKIRESPPDCPLPGTPRSYTATPTPRSLSACAVDRPTIPAPTTATSARPTTPGNVTAPRPARPPGQLPPVRLRWPR
jgi:hypothetical protein